MQKPNLDYLEKTTLSKDLDHEEINNAHYQMDVLFDQHCHGIEFKHCLFENVNMQDVNLKIVILLMLFLKIVIFPI